jgi:electron transport complex protein RnfA
MSYIGSFFSFFFTVALIENIVFARGLGTSKAFSFMNSRRSLFIHSLSLTAVLIPATTISFFVEKAVFSLHQSTKNVIIPVINLVIVSVLYFAAVSVISFFKSTKITEEIKNLLPGVVYSYITLGTLFLASRQALIFIQRIALVLGSVVGFMLATLLISYSAVLSESASVPRVFRGIPIKILYIGLLSLAFYGLSGHELSF